MTAGLGLLAIFVVRFVVPDPERHLHHRDIAPDTGQIRAILGDGNLLRLDIGIFVLHMVLTALFVGLPGMLQAKTGLPVGEHWKLYIPVLVLSVVAMVPLVVLGSRNRTTALAYRIAIVVLMVALALLAWTGDLGMWPLLGAVFVFFTAFNALEAMLPSLISRLAPAAGKGTAIGVYNSFQFVGMFAGGVAAGYLGTHYGPASVYWFCALVVAVWAVVAMTAPAFRLSRSEIVPIGTCTDSQRTELIDKIRSIDGVQEVTIVKGDSVAYLKIDDETFDRTQLQQLIRT
jgi:MFS family permease